MSELVSAGGGYGMMKSGVQSKFVLVSANAVIGDTASELGGGKFANSAITAAFVMLFNELGDHQKKTWERVATYKFSNVRQLPFDEKVGMSNAAYTMTAIVLESYSGDNISVTILGNSYNTSSEDIKPWMIANVYLDGKRVLGDDVQRHFNNSYQ